MVVRCCSVHGVAQASSTFIIIPTIMCIAPSTLQQVVDTALHAAQHVKRKRESRGLQPRAVRAVVVGFPNVGKSALINRLVGRRACDSAPKPGVTRQVGLSVYVV